MNQHFSLNNIAGDWSEFTAVYTHNESGEEGTLQVVHDFENDFIVTGVNHEGTDINETAEVAEQSEPTPEQIFWLVVDTLKAVLCPSCGTTNPE